MSTMNKMCEARLSGAVMATVPYHDHPSPEAIEIAASEISVIHTANPRTKTFIAAREALRQAHRIYFLGFGYNGTNHRGGGLALWRSRRGLALI
jgi:hypothetical protein